jgi:hypothetical protein
MSRQITENAVRAFLLGDNFKQSNTEVHADCTGVYMFLFGNMIAVRVGNRLQITTAGWNTTTTRERLNGLPNVSVTQRKGKLYLNGKEWDGELITIGE